MPHECRRGPARPHLLGCSRATTRRCASSRLTELLGESPDERRGGRGTARHHDHAAPCRLILAAQGDDGHWEGRDRFYTAKYRGTVWQLIILAELGADGADERVRRGCEAILRDAQDRDSGGFATIAARRPAGGFTARHPVPDRQPRLEPHPPRHARRPARAGRHRLAHHLHALRRRRRRGAHRLALRPLGDVLGASHLPHGRRQGAQGAGRDPTGAPLARGAAHARCGQRVHAQLTTSTSAATT